MRLCNFFQMKCSSDDCPWTKNTATSSFLNKEVVTGKVPRNVNIRSVLAFREFGREDAAIKTCCGVVNIPSMTSKTYRKTTENMPCVYMDSARESTKVA